MIQLLSQRSGSIRYFIVSQEHCTCKNAVHCHAYVKLNRAWEKSWFHPNLYSNIWLQPLEKRCWTWPEATQRYIKYIKGKGPHYKEVGCLREPKSKLPMQSQTSEILTLIKNGKRLSEIVRIFPHQTRNIKMLVEYRPP